MAKLPTYESTRNMDTRPGKVLQTGAREKGQAIVGLAKTGLDIAQKWQQAEDTMEYNGKVSNYKIEMLDLQQRASTDPDKDAYKEYAKEAERIRNRNLQGFSNKMMEEKAAMQFDVDNKVFNIQAEKIFRDRKAQYSLMAIGKRAEADVLSAAMLGADSALIQQNLFTDIDQNVEDMIFTPIQGEKLKEDFKRAVPMQRAKNAINLDPTEAAKLLSKGAFGIEDPEDKRSMMNLASSMIRHKEVERKVQQIDGKFGIVEAIVSGDLNKDNAPSYIKALDVEDQEMSVALEKAFDERGGLYKKTYTAKEKKNKQFQKSMRRVFAAKDKEAASRVLMDVLEQGDISQDRLAIMVDAALLSTENKSVFGKTAEIVANSFEAGWKVLAATTPPGMVIDQIAKYVAEVKEAGVDKSVQIAVKMKYDVAKSVNPYVSSAPKEGQPMPDGQGNYAIVYPDREPKEISKEEYETLMGRGKKEPKE